MIAAEFFRGRWPESRGARIALWIGAVFVVLIALLLLFLALFDWDRARGPIGRYASARLEREVRLDGPLSVRLFSWKPSAEIRDLHVSNPDWLQGGDMVFVPRMQVVIDLKQLFRGRLVLDRLEVDDPELVLVHDSMGRANWQMGERDPEAGTGAEIPAMRAFTLRGGKLQFSDDVRDIRFQGMVVATETGRADLAEPFQLKGDGTFNGALFSLMFTGGALLNLRVDEPYAFNATVTAGATRAQLRGRIAEPFDLGRFDSAVQLSGRNLGDLYYLTGLTLPRTPEYRLSLQLQRMDTRFELHGINGKVGSSDLRGDAAVELKGDRPLLTGDLVSQSLRLADLSVAFGATEPGAAKPPYVLPREEFKVGRLQQMDARVNFRATAIQTGKVPLTGVNMKINLDAGVLKLDPVVFTLPQGELSGSAVVDSGQRPAAVSLDVRLNRVRLDQFKSKTATEAPMQGTLQSRATLKGRGDSVHAVAASGSGRMTAVIPRGEIREALAELTGINVLRGLGLLISQSEQTAVIRCGVAEFQIEKGQARATRIVFDTEHVAVDGEGGINLDDESLDLKFRGKPKEFRLVRLRTPITVRGTMKKPAFGIDASKAVAQGGVATAIGSVLTPLAAILAFVDPGLAKDADCAALLEETEPKTK